MDCKIFVEQRKYRVLNLLENDDLSQHLTTNPNETNVHIVGMGSMNPPVRQEYQEELRHSIAFSLSLAAFSS